MDETEHEETPVTYNPFIKDPSYFNLFECGKNLLNRLYATCKRSCMETSRDKYYTKRYETLIDYNERNDAPFFNENIRDSMHKVIQED